MPKRILLCDDEIHIVRAMAVKFARAGYEVHEASDGEEGWERLLAIVPDLVITDCQMPRLNGIGLAERIHNEPRTAHIPVVMLTGKSFEISHQELRDRFNVLAVLSKPFSPRDLLARAEKLIGAANDTPVSPLAPTSIPASVTLTSSPDSNIPCLS